MSGNGASSNAEQVKAVMERLAGAFDFTRPGASGSSFGRDLLANTAVDIRDETVALQQSPDGSPLAPNRGKYAREKAEKGLPVGIGLRGEGDKGRMLSDTEVSGMQEITPDVASMKYGKTPGARAKAEWFTGGSEGADGCAPSGARNQAPRKFFGISEAARARRVEDCREQLHRAIRAAGGVS